MFLVGTLLRFGVVTAWLFHLVACMGSCCLGCDAKNKLMKSQSQSLTRPMSKPDTWTSSRSDMDNTRNTSHGFINHGKNIMYFNLLLLLSFSTSLSCFLLWNQSRQQWTANKRNNQREKTREPRLSRNATYDNLLGSNKPFANPIPLSEMVDFLVDVWEKEGLYD
ncbi:hypothetical protein LXL04_032082 [Taraxacum kok-saghyz]